MRFVKVSNRFKILPRTRCTPYYLYHRVDIGLGSAVYYFVKDALKDAVRNFTV